MNGCKPSRSFTVNGGCKSRVPRSSTGGYVLSTNEGSSVAILKLWQSLGAVVVEYYIPILSHFSTSPISICILYTVHIYIYITYITYHIQLLWYHHMGYVSHYIRLYLSHFVDFILPSYFKKCQRVYRSTDPSFLIMLDFKPIHRWFFGGKLFAMCQPNCNLNGKKNMDHLLPSVLTQYYYIWYKSPPVDISVTNPSWSDKPTETYHQFTKKPCVCWLDSQFADSIPIV